MAEFDSKQIANQKASPSIANDKGDQRARVRAWMADYTQAAAGAADDEINLVDLMGGVIRLYDFLLVFSALGAARVVDIGWREYADADGNVIAANQTGIATGIDVSAAGSALTQVNKQFSSRNGVRLYATVRGGTIPAAATFTARALAGAD